VIGPGRSGRGRRGRAAAVVLAACLPIAPDARPVAAAFPSPADAGAGAAGAAAGPDAGTAAGPGAPDVLLAIDPGASRLAFTVHRPGETVEGTAEEFSGEVRFDPGDPSRSSVTLRVRAASLQTGNRIRDRRMRRSHLEVDAHPEIVFRSTRITPGESARRALVEGILDLHGVERTMLFAAAIRYDNGSLAAEGDLVLRLSDHGIPIPRFLWLVLDDEVRVRFRFRAAPRGAGG
jgi:polyisoprenoid-binding protein YceI